MLLNSILTNVSALSEALNAENDGKAVEERQANQNVSNTMSVEEEVSSIFTTTGPRVMSRPRPPTAASTSTSAGIHAPSTSTGLQTGRLGITRAIGRQHVFRPSFFPALPSRQRPIISNKKQQQFNKGSKVSQEKTTKANKGPFYVDVVLLRGPGDMVVPKQQPKIELMERGHIFQGVTFYKQWSLEDVQQKIHDLFSSILGKNEVFDIGTSIHTKIVKPTLDKGQMFDGMLLHRMFRQKTLYIMPRRELFQLEMESLKEEDTEDTDDYEDQLFPSKCPRIDINLTDDSSSDEFPPAFNIQSTDTNKDTSVRQGNSDIKESFANLSSHLAHVVAGLQDRVLSSVNRIVVRRRKLWEDAMEKVSLFYDSHESNPSLVIPLEIEFIGEEGVDGGGVRREFFCIAFEKSPQKLMAGGENMLTFRRDAHKLESKEFETFGKLIALAFLNGCDSPHNWCPNLIQYVLDPDDNEINFDIEAIPDGEVKAKMLELAATIDDKSMNKVLDCDILTDARFEAGFNCTHVSFHQKTDLIQKICKHFIITKQLEEIQSCMKGMQLGGILQILRQHKVDAVGEFTYEDGHLSPQELLNLFNIKYSNDESKKEQEEDIIYNFTNLLDHIQRKPLEVNILDYETVLSMDEVAAKNAEDGGLKKIRVKLEDVLQFLTGSKFIGSIKEVKGEITFCHDGSSGKRVKINTCGAGILFPVTSRYVKSDSFSTSFVEDIYSSPGFGIV